MPKTTIAKWGNSLAVRLPRGTATEAGLAEGTVVDLGIEDGVLVIRLARPRYRMADLLKGYGPEHRRGEEWPDDPPRGREAW